MNKKFTLKLLIIIFSLFSITQLLPNKANLDVKDDFSYFSSDEVKFLISFQDFLDKYKYSKNYTLGVFDCSDMSYLLEKFLEENGYHAMVAVDVLKRHAWVVVEIENKWFAIESTCSDESLGCLVPYSDSLTTFYFEDYFSFTQERIILKQHKNA
ncbi:MAG: hypothetical protein ACTSX6_03280 [Candidatus Heimdallarchaeaceae archaeon]